MSSNQITIKNELNEDLVVYQTTVPTPANPPVITPESLYPVYRRLGLVFAGNTGQFTPAEALLRLVICQVKDDFPIKLWVPPILDDKPELTITAADLPPCRTAFKFYEFYKANPYAPLSLQFNEIVLNSGNILSLDKQVSDLLARFNYGNCGYHEISLVSYWAENSAFAWTGAYYCYESGSGEDQFFISTRNPCGLLVSHAGKPRFLPGDTPGQPIELTYQKSTLQSLAADRNNKISLTGILRSLSWEGRPDEITMCWAGSWNGKKIIAQPYKDPTIPWWVAAYDLAFATFLGIQVLMAAEMGITVLKGMGNGLKYLAEGAGKLYAKIRGNCENAGTEADPMESMSEEFDMVNVDVDTDTDTDTDSVTDTVDVTDTDVDVDTDVDDDVFAAIDIDIDTDVDIDTDTNVDTNTVDVVDTDIDVDVNVQPGRITGLLNKIGSWLMEKGFPALIKNLAVFAAFEGASRLLNVWREAGERAMHNLSPQETTGLGLLLEFMNNDKNSARNRWSTFADYVQQAQPDIAHQKIFITMLLMIKSRSPDEDKLKWKWPSDEQQNLINRMAGYGLKEQYRAYNELADYAYQGKTLPLKFSCGTVMRYLDKV